MFIRKKFSRQPHKKRNKPVNKKKLEQLLAKKEAAERKKLQDKINKKDNKHGIHGRKKLSRFEAMGILFYKRGFLWKKELAHKSFGESVKYLTAYRGNYYFENFLLKKKILETNLKVLEIMTTMGYKFFIITELDKSNKKFIRHRPEGSQRYTYKNLWLQGHLLRHSLDTLAEEDRERDRLGLKRIDEKFRKWPFPQAIITLSMIDRIIPILEARKLNIPTFSFSSYNTEEFARSLYKFALNRSKKYHTEIVYWLIYETIVNSKLFRMRAPSLFLKIALKKLTNFNRKIRKHYRRSIMITKENKKTFSRLFKKIIKKRRLTRKFYKFKKRRRMRFFLRRLRVRMARTILRTEFVRANLTSRKFMAKYKGVKIKIKPYKRLKKLNKKKPKVKINCPLSDLNRYSYKRTRF